MHDAAEQLHMILTCQIPMPSCCCCCFWLCCSSNKQPLGTPRRAGQGCQFHSCTTTNYKLHYLETATGYKVCAGRGGGALHAYGSRPCGIEFISCAVCCQIVLNTGRDAGDLRELLIALYDELLVERLAKNPAYKPGTTPAK